MIIEQILPNQRVLHYSNKNKKILQVETGIIYENAIDILPCRYTYEETEEEIEFQEDLTSEEILSELEEIL